MAHLRVPIANPRPDITAFMDAIAGRRSLPRPPLVEYLVDEAVMGPVVELIGRTWVPLAPNDHATQQPYWDNVIAFWHHCGYDFVRVELAMPFPADARCAADAAQQAPDRIRTWSETERGPIATWKDFERYPWPKPSDADIFPLDYICRHLPDGMGLISCHAGGVFEHVSRLFGYVTLCTAIYDTPDLVAAVVQRVGELIEEYYRRLLQLERLVVVFQGDDMGFRSGTLISPDHLRQYILPWHKRLASLAHHARCPYYLHSCGNLHDIMDDLVNDVLIDAKHSFEDAICPVGDIKRHFGDRIGILGGVDLDVLARLTPDQVRSYVRRVINECTPGGRYAIGSGNSIPSYVPVENYLTMLDEALA